MATSLSRSNKQTYSIISNEVGDLVGISGDALKVSANSLDIRPLSSGTDSVAVTATDFNIRALSSGTDSVAVTATDFNIRALSSGTDSILIYGSQDNGEIVVMANDFGIRALNAETDNVSIKNTYYSNLLWEENNGQLYDGSATNYFSIDSRPVLNLFGSLTGITTSTTFRLQVNTVDVTDPFFEDVPWVDTTRTIVVVGDDNQHGILEFSTSDLAVQYIRLMKIDGDDCSGHIIGASRSN
jgi:hypothetical protein